MEKLKLLIIDDNKGDGILIIQSFKKNGYAVQFKIIDSIDEFENTILEGWDCIILDYSVGPYSGFEFVEVYKKRNLNIPLIMFSGTIGEDAAIKAMKAGVYDYIMKDNIIKLVPSVERAIYEYNTRKSNILIEKELKEKRESFSNLIKQLADCLIIYNLEGKILEVNQNSCYTFGYTEEEFLKLNIYDIDPTNEKNKFQEGLQNFNTGQTIYSTRQLKKKNDTYFPTEIRLSSNYINNELHFIILIRDITEKKLWEERIFRLNKLYFTRTRINKIITQSTDRNYLFNNICKSIINYSYISLAWIGFFDQEKKILKPEYYSKNYDYFKNLIISFEEDVGGDCKVCSLFENKKSYVIQNFGLKENLKDWEKKLSELGHKSVSIIPFFFRDEIEGVIVVYSKKSNSFGVEDISLLNSIGRDISHAIEMLYQMEEHKKELEEKKIREEQLRQAQKMEAIGQLAGGIAHDFNNIMGIIIGNMDLLEMHIKNKHEAKALEKLDKILKVTLRGAEVTKRLLKFSGKLVDSDETIFNPIKLIKDMQEVLERSIQNREINFSLSNAPGNIKCNLSDLENAFLNLCINAKDATPINGIINISIDKIKIFGEGLLDYKLPVKEGNYFSISIEDNGTGISPKKIEKIFEPFFSTKKELNGTGLGLFNVYSFLKNSGGSIKVESIQGKGTKFTMILPEFKLTEEAQKIDVNKEGKLKLKKVLIIDDEIELIDIIKTYLSLKGIDSIYTTSVQEGLEKLKTEKTIDLVISDIVMPGLINGIKFADTISKDFPSIKIILITGFSKDLENSNDFQFPILRKPFSKEDLYSRINRIFKLT